MHMVSNTERLIAEMHRELEGQERSVSWLASKSGIKYGTLLRKLRGATEFTISEVLRISEALDIDPKMLIGNALADAKAAA